MRPEAPKAQQTCLPASQRVLHWAESVFLTSKLPQVPPILDVIFVFQEVPTEEGLILVVVLRCFKSKSSSIVFPALHKG